MIEYTNELEKKMKEGVTYRDCFKGIDLRRTEIVVGIWLVQTLGGQNLMGYFAYFLQVPPTFPTKDEGWRNPPGVRDFVR